MKNKKLNLKPNRLLLGFILIFFLSFFLGTWNLGKAGQVWDEEALVALGYKHITLVKNLDFNDDFWWKSSASDHPPLVRYVRGLAATFDIEGFRKDGTPIFNYDLTHDRWVSTFLFIATSLLIYFFAAKFISFYASLTSGIIFSMLPIPLGHFHYAMFEPFNLFFYTASVVLYILYLTHPSRLKLIFTGIVLGLAFLSKETNLMLIPVFFGILLIKKNFTEKTNLKPLLLQTVYIFLVAFFVFFIMWPMPFFHLKEFLELQWSLRGATTTSIPEVFFGRLMLVPKVYYIVHFLITTPLLILFLFLIGLKKIDKSKNWIFYTLIFWFIFPFILSFYPKREQGIRYIIQICAPLAIIAGIGFESLIVKFGNNIRGKALGLLLLFIYLFIILYRITPYYTNYFNGLVGGASNVYRERLFHLAWWGEGIKEAFDFLETTPDGSIIGIATTPSHILPPIKNKKIEMYQDSKKFDYVVVNFYNVVRIGFDDSYVKANYYPVYKVMADGAPIVIVYKK